jgi:hypothetical protein
MNHEYFTLLTDRCNNTGHTMGVVFCMLPTILPRRCDLRCLDCDNHAGCRCHGNRRLLPGPFGKALQAQAAVLEGGLDCFGRYFPTCRLCSRLPPRPNKQCLSKCGLFREALRIQTESLRAPYLHFLACHRHENMPSSRLSSAFHWLPRDQVHCPADLRLLPW